MRLRLIAENTDSHIREMEKIIYDIAPNSVGKKIIDFLKTPHKYTNPSDRHTISIARSELMNGDRLVALIEQDNIDEDGGDLYINGTSRWVVVSLPENSDIANFVHELPDNIPGYATHMIRGIIFGYDPESVYNFSMSKRLCKPWKTYLRNLGIDLAENYGGYSSVADTDGWLSTKLGIPTGCIIVFPNEAPKIKSLSTNLGNLLFITKFCPKCNNYINIYRSLSTDYGAINSCSHGDGEGTFYEFNFDITNIMPELAQ